MLPNPRRYDKLSLKNLKTSQTTLPCGINLGLESFCQEKLKFFKFEQPFWRVLLLINTYIFYKNLNTFRRRL
ncbi:MAG: hypothetical protein N3E45_10945 [Oscillatoriaceae bacterium SKW80]|nr:hypothetical protein [Oscillatoriaceae bacterium SKYG93]MCX8121329.1 hypothetical protein [Oscillatoriaceae bacterium SKW80]MDW8453337.1 hypothetical protein [Oscillatoriaceae cyanobacterium SKYGB_i_bin93]HIK26691.1 hypothetical protein [Oscillatoriaceae cyanobacterium M7585_C2015_266]